MKRRFVHGSHGILNSTRPVHDYSGARLRVVYFPTKTTTGSEAIPFATTSSLLNPPS